MGRILTHSGLIDYVNEELGSVTVSMPSGAVNHRAVTKSDIENIQGVPSNVTISCSEVDKRCITSADLSVVVSSDNPTAPIVDEEWIDLGLPSGILWRNRNIDATNVYDTGSYFQWAYPTARSSWSQATYPYYSYDTKYYDKTLIEQEDDVSYIRLGEGCSTPTRENWEELHSFVNIEQILEGGVKCIKLSSKQNSNYIILPLGGFGYENSILYLGEHACCWSKDSKSDGAHGGLAYMFGYSTDTDYVYNAYVESFRYMGLNVRPVKSST